MVELCERRAHLGGQGRTNIVCIAGPCVGGRSPSRVLQPPVLALVDDLPVVCVQRRDDDHRRVGHWRVVRLVGGLNNRACLWLGRSAGGSLAGRLELDTEVYRCGRHAHEQEDQDADQPEGTFLVRTGFLRGQRGGYNGLWEGGVGAGKVVASSYTRVHFIDIALERAVGEDEDEGEGEVEAKVRWGQKIKPNTKAVFISPNPTR